MIHKISRRKQLAISIIALSPQLAFSQGESLELEEVVVTATKRAQSMQEVPIAISAISSSDLKKSGVFETSDLNRSAPNLQVSSPYGQQQPNFSIRGVGVGTEFNANSASPIGIYVDEVYQTFRASHGQQLYDLEQIEVVRGPQGTLYGRNTTGGAINFITRQPSLSEAEGKLTLGYGNYDRKSVEAAAEFSPIEDKFGIRVAGTWVETDSYTDNVLSRGLNTTAAEGASGLNYNTGIQPGGTENYGIRASFRYITNNDSDLMFKVYTAETKGGTETPIPTGSTKGSDVIDYTNPNFLLSGLFSQLAPLGVLPDSYSQSGSGRDVRDVEVDSLGNALIEADGVVFKGNFTVSDTMNLVAIAGYDSGDYEQMPTTDCDASPLRVCTIGYASEFDATNFDVRLDYREGDFGLILGATYGFDSLTSTNRPDFFNFLRDVNAAFGSVPEYFNPGGGFNGSILPDTALPTGITATNNFKQERESWAIYGEGNYAFSDALNFTFGLRYSKDTLEFSEGLTTYFDDAGNPRMITVSDNEVGGSYAPYFLDDVLNPDGSVAVPASVLNAGNSTPQALELEDGSESVSGRMIIDWAVAEDVMLYASYSRGYRAGTVNGLAYGSSNQIYFVPPEEVDAFELGMKSRVFDSRVQVNAAVFHYDYTGQQGQVVDSTATANLISFDGKISGLELDIELLATPNFTIKGSLGLLDTEYASGDCPADADTLLAGRFPAQLGSCVLSSGGAASVAGNSFPYAPDLTFNGSFDWHVAQIGNGGLSLHGSAAYTGDFYYDSFEEYDTGILPNVTSGDFTEGGGDYWTYSARLTYETEEFSIALWGKNLTDEEYYPYGIAVENLFGNGYRVMGPPRTFGAEISFFL